jgi:hypothetical protein
MSSEKGLPFDLYKRKSVSMAVKMQLKPVSKGSSARRHLVIGVV